MSIFLVGEQTTNARVGYLPGRQVKNETVHGYQTGKVPGLFHDKGKYFEHMQM
jgi:hypothetical protein